MNTSVFSNYCTIQMIQRVAIECILLHTITVRKLFTRLHILYSKHWFNGHTRTVYAKYAYTISYQIWILYYKYYIVIITPLAQQLSCRFQSPTYWFHLKKWLRYVIFMFNFQEIDTIVKIVTASHKTTLFEDAFTKKDIKQQQTEYLVMLYLLCLC